MAALRSGEYQQVREQLAVDSPSLGKGYCCEGVAVERYGKKLGYKAEWLEGELSLDGLHDYASNDFWHDMGLVGVTSSPGTSYFTFKLPDGLTSLTEQSEFTYMSLNDDGFTFSHIADLIEWQFLSGSRD